MFTHRDVCSKNNLMLPGDIQDVIIAKRCRMDERVGEFNVKTCKGRNLATECEDSLISRMMAHLRELIFMALPQVEVKVNRIIRLSTHEFYFYPNKHRGPLSLTGLSRLIKAIRQVAQEQPAYLHLNLGTFSVVDNHQEFLNVLIYVQCGREPQINLLAKSFPWDSDPYYPGTKSRFFCSGSVGIGFAREMNNRFDLLLDEAKKVESLVLYTHLCQFLEFCQSNPDFNSKESRVDKVEQEVKKILTAIYHGKVWNFSYLKQAVQEYGSWVREQTLNHYQKAEQTLQKNLPFLEIDQTGHLQVSYDGVIVCTMPNGYKYLTLIEICYEHKFNLAKKRMETLLNNARKDAFNLLPVHISRVVVSNSIDLNEVFSRGWDITRVDPECAKVIDPAKQKKLELNEPEFGGQATILVYPAKSLDELPLPEKREVEDYNKIVTLIAKLKPHFYRFAASPVIKQQYYFLWLILAIQRNDQEEVMRLLPKTEILAPCNLQLGFNPIDMVVDKKNWELLMCMLPFVSKAYHPPLHFLRGKNTMPGVKKLLRR